MMKASRLAIFVFLFFVALIWQQTDVIEAQTVPTCTFTASTGIWNTINIAFWSCTEPIENRVPTINDHVIIPDTVTSLVVSQGTTYVAASITNAGVLNIGNNASQTILTIAGDVTNTGTIRPNSGGAQPATPRIWLIGGNLANNGTIDLRSEVSQGGGGPAAVDVTFNGSGLQTLGGSNPVHFNSLTLDSDTTVILATLPTAKGVVANSGTLRQSRAVDNETAAFLHIESLPANGSVTKYRGAEITTAADLGSVTVSIQGVDTTIGQYCTTDEESPPYVSRCYTITAENPGNPATLRLWVANEELNGVSTADLTPYHWDGSTWQELSEVAQGNDGSDYYYGEGGTTSFSSFLLGGEEAPTAVTLTSLFIGAGELSGGGLWLGLVLLTLLITALIVWKRQSFMVAE